MISEVPIGRKLMLSAVAALALTLGVGFIALNGIGNLGGATDKLVNVTAKKRFLASDMDTAMAALLAAERGILVRAYMKDQATMEQYNQDFQASEVRAKKRLNEFVALNENAEERRLCDEIGSAMETIQAGHGEFWTHASSGEIDAATETYKTKTNPAIKQAVKIAEEFAVQQTDVLNQVAQETAAAVSGTRWKTLAGIVFALLVAVAAVFIVSQVNQRLRQAVTELTEGSGQVARAAGQITSSSQSLAQGSSEQAASLEETSASTEQISSMAHKNSDNSRAAAELVTLSQQKFAQTNQSLEQMVVAMSEINAQSDKISKIIRVIDEIAFQTNILALNAAVEAARAGEAGMGFAVVADEVRNLAQRCAQAAKDTATLIEESIAKSSDGKTRVDQAAEAIRAITGEAGRIKTFVDEIYLGSQEQARGIEQIGKAIAQMEQVTQKAASYAEETASTAAELNSQSETLDAVVHRLTAMVTGEAANSHSRRAAPVG
jgi:methyl-accepting chemotaxis protein/methyl-accepting chemotaxis protein-1 (serine sensor receptor)